MWKQIVAFDTLNIQITNSITWDHLDSKVWLKVPIVNVGKFSKEFVKFMEDYLESEEEDIINWALWKK